MESKIHILFVCTGNICRSPTAHGVFLRLLADQHLSDRFMVDSAGTHAYHSGEPPDQRSQEAALRCGINISDLRARQINQDDFAYYHYILAMDRDNYHLLQRNAPPQYRNKIHLFLQFAPQLIIDEVPDPYYGGSQGFEQVLDIITIAAQGLLAELQRTVLITR